jgi:hypothetical protein
VAVGDLTGDGRPEAAVLLSCSPQPSNFYVEEVHAFEDGPKLLGTLPHLQPLPGGLVLDPLFDPDHFAISGGQLLWVPEPRS